jgi:hypothetical protein
MVNIPSFGGGSSGSSNPCKRAEGGCGPNGSSSSGGSQPPQEQNLPSTENQPSSTENQPPSEDSEPAEEDPTSEEAALRRILQSGVMTSPDVTPGPSIRDQFIDILERLGYGDAGNSRLPIEEPAEESPAEDEPVEEEPAEDEPENPSESSQDQNDLPSSHPNQENPPQNPPQSEAESQSPRPEENQRPSSENTSPEQDLRMGGATGIRDAYRVFNGGEALSDAELAQESSSFQNGYRDAFESNLARLRNSASQQNPDSILGKRPPGPDSGQGGSPFKMAKGSIK